MAALVAVAVSSFYFVWREETEERKMLIQLSSTMTNLDESRKRHDAYIKGMCAFEQQLPDLKKVCKGENK